MSIKKTNPDEIQNIINALGRSDLTEGNVRGTHLGKILHYLQMNKTEIYQTTLYKLALMLGMNIRYVRENYLKGLELFGVIKTRMVNNELVWNWYGDKFICSNNGGELEQVSQSATEYMKEQDLQKQKEKVKKGDKK